MVSSHNVNEPRVSFFTLLFVSISVPTAPGGGGEADAVAVCVALGHVRQERLLGRGSVAVEGAGFGRPHAGAAPPARQSEFLLLYVLLF